jgi:hypothetical protein
LCPPCRRTDNVVTLITATPITLNSVDGMHTVFAETGENRSIQRQLITPPTAGQSCALESDFYARWDTAPLRELHARFGCRFVQVVCSAETAVLIERFIHRSRSGERHPGHADASALDELIPRIVNERWDALHLDGPVIYLDTSNMVDIEQVIHNVRQLIGCIE